MRKSGPPPPGQRSIASFFGARPAAAAPGAAAAAAVGVGKVCFFSFSVTIDRLVFYAFVFSVLRLGALFFSPLFSYYDVTIITETPRRAR